MLRPCEDRRIGDKSKKQLVYYFYFFSFFNKLEGKFFWKKHCFPLLKGISDDRRTRAPFVVEITCLGGQWGQARKIMKK